MNKKPSHAAVEQLATQRLKDQETTLRHEVMRLRLEAKDARRYLKEQEQLVEEATANWAASIGEFKEENDYIVEEKKQLLEDKIRIQQEIVAMEKKAKELEDKIESLDEVFTSKMTDYKRQLSEVKTTLLQSSQ